jgi:hypothetical protein
MLSNPARASTSRLANAVASTSRASSSSTKAYLPNGRLPASTLRTLIDLHHTSASFMHSPATLPDAIVRTFRDYNKESQESYQTFAGRVQTLKGDGSALVGRGNDYDSIGEAGSRGLAAFSSRPKLSDAFSRDTDVQGQRSWAESAKYRELRDGPSAREAAVREAMYGSWESGNEILPGLEGVLEYLDVETQEKPSVTQAAAGEETEDSM